MIKGKGNVDVPEIKNHDKVHTLMQSSKSDKNMFQYFKITFICLIIWHHVIKP